MDVNKMLLDERNKLPEGEFQFSNSGSGDIMKITL
jgi:hypothetical protein